MLSDDIIPYYRKSQDTMTRRSLDYRNSSEREPTFYEKCSEKFNDITFIPFSTAYPNLHPDFSNVIELKKGRFEMTPEKCKEMINKSKPFLKSMIVNYELSGEGSMSRIDSEAGWGKFDITLCEGNDDRSRFLKNPNMSYLLYMWQKYDEYDLVEFSCAHIPGEMTADSSTSPFILKDKTETKYEKESISKNVGRVGDGINLMASMEMERQVHELEETKLKWEIKKLEFNPIDHEKTINLLDDRIKNIDTQLRQIKKMRTNRE
jgi:hypothetical protein